MTNVAILQTTADLSASQTAQAIAQLVPTGTVFAYAGTSAPSGWLTCDGTAISRTTYASLFSALGVAHGYGDNSTTFNLPDYRGRFVRGADAMFGGTSAARDPNNGTRTAANTGGNTGNNVGSVQANATAKNSLALTGTTTFADSGHQHQLLTTGSDILTVQALTTGGVNKSVQTQIVPASDLRATTTTSSGSSVSLGSGDNETRPLNAYVNYIIKI